MKIAIARSGDNIATIKDYQNINDKGEISHFLIEIELIKQDLLDLWTEWHETEE
jgi:hypothetical protein